MTKLKTLGDSDSDDDALSWVNKNRKLTKERRIAENKVLNTYTCVCVCVYTCFLYRKIQCIYPMVVRCVCTICIICVLVVICPPISEVAQYMAWPDIEYLVRYREPGRIQSTWHDTAGYLA